MKQLEHALPSPAECLAADEALLDRCEAGHGDELLAFWEPRETFVVVGYANKISTEVNLAACRERNIPVFRRCSGGGTVVQMPGGLNYSLILRITETGPTRNISAANEFIMDKNRAAMQAAIGQPEPVVSVRGHTDLTLTTTAPAPVTLKFAGNAQRRRKHFLLFHGTLLIDCKLQLISELLQMPSLQPDYRHSRAHEDFVTNLNLPVAKVKAALTQAWGANEVWTQPPLDEITRLAESKYLTDDWNYKF